MINVSNFVQKEIPDYNPLSRTYKNYWRMEKRKCIEGVWVGGKWMPGNLYFYMNYGHIKLNEDIFSKNKTIARPMLRDIDWEFFIGWCEARGFSGFSNDPEYTCNISVLNPTNERLAMRLTPNVYKKDGTFKTYVKAREYMSKIHKGDMGVPLWENEAKNFMMLGSRGFGKSYSVANGIILHEFLFAPKGTEIVVGAGDSFYSGELLKKVKFAMDHLPGGKMYSNVFYPPPFSKKYAGSWGSGKSITASFKAKVGNDWRTQGSGNVIHHRSFSDNPTAANGTRPSVMVFEEIGMFPNLEEALGASMSCISDDTIQFGSAMLLGTGGDMEGGGTLAAQKMFYDPETYNLVVYEDLWEHRGKIAYFVPSYLAKTKFKTFDPKSETWVSDEEKARKDNVDTREALKMGKSTRPLDNYICYNPLVPSEVFLSSHGNIFPVNLLKDQLGYVETNKVISQSIVYGTLRDEGGKPVFIKGSEYRPLNEFPLSAGVSDPGCVAIYEFPPKMDNGEPIPPGMYIAGCDPYAHSVGATSNSVGALYIYKRYTDFDNTYNIIVAEYVGRPNELKEFHETVRLLLMYYNAECLYENNINNLHAYMSMMNCDYLLADQPDELIKDTIRHSVVKRGKGIHMNDQIKARGENAVRDWLLEKKGEDEAGDPILNLHSIKSVGLLKELIAYNNDGNFDRVIAFMCALMLEVNKTKVRVKNIVKETKRDPFWDRKLFKRTRRVF